MQLFVTWLINIYHFLVKCLIEYNMQNPSCCGVQGFDVKWSCYGSMQLVDQSFCFYISPQPKEYMQVSSLDVAVVMQKEYNENTLISQVGVGKPNHAMLLFFLVSTCYSPPGSRALENYQHFA